MEEDMIKDAQEGNEPAQTKEERDCRDIQSK